MKIWNLVAILAISCLLPILAQKQDNGTDTSGSTCENEIGQFCIDKNDTHKCMFPLAKPECPAGKQCCKTFPKDYDSAGLPLTRGKKCTKKCPCCIASVEEIMTNLESAMKGVEEKIDNGTSAMKGVEEKIDNGTSAMKDVEEKIVDMDSAMKGVEEKIDNGTSAMKGVEEKIADMDSAMKGVEEKIDNGTSAMKGVEGKMEDVNSEMKGVEEKMTNVESAMNGVEEKMTNLISVMKDQLSPLYCALKGYQIAYRDSCYFISSSTENWWNAQAKCVDMGGNLVKIDNDEEFSFLQDQVNQSPWIGSNDLGAWIGLNDIEVEGQFTWIADGSIDQIPASWWPYPQPDNAGNNEDCVHYWPGNQGLLNDLPCSITSVFYICETPSINL